MAKTKDELNVLKKEFESLRNRLSELSDDEFKQVTGGMRTGGDIYIGGVNKPQVVIPNVVDKCEGDAINMLNNFGFTYEITYIVHNKPTGVVVNCDPSVGSYVTMPYTVRLFVSRK